MPTLTGIGLAITIDVLLRISVVLMAALVLALAARRNAALRHAVLVAGLAAASLMPVAMLAVPRLPLGWLGRVERDDSAVSPRLSVEGQHRRASLDHPSPAIIREGKDEGREDPRHGLSPHWDASPLGPRPPSWRNWPHGRWIVRGLASIWMLGAVVRVAGLGLSLVRLRRIVARAHPVESDQLRSMLEWIQQQIPMRRPPRLLESAEVSAPVAAGVVGNDILLPAGWAGRLRLGETLAILCHESAHLARCDHRVVILQELLASVLWFHPLVPLFNRMLNRAREEVCDNYAIAVVDRASYCEALLLLAVGRPGASLRGATSMWSRRWSLEDRVRGILDEDRPTRTGISKVARTVTAMASLAICGLVAMPRLAASSANDRSETAASPPRTRAGLVTSVSTRMVNRSFPIDGREWLRFENLAGRVELVRGHGSAVEVEAVVRVGELPGRDAERLIDNIRWVEAPAEGGESRWGLALPEGRYAMVRYPVSGESPPGVTTVDHLGRKVLLSDRPGESVPAVEFDLRIAVPPRARVAIENAVGPVGGVGLVAPLRVATHAGSIQLRNVRAPVTATSDLGPIMITDLEGDASLRTGSGGIELARVAGGRVAVTTRSGGCRIAQPADAAFTLRNLRERPVVVFADGVRRGSLRSGDPYFELLSRGSGGPVITVDAGAGECVFEPDL